MIRWREFVGKCMITADIPTSFNTRHFFKSFQLDRRLIHLNDLRDIISYS